MINEERIIPKIYLIFSNFEFKEFDKSWLIHLLADVYRTRAFSIIVNKLGMVEIKIC